MFPEKFLRFSLRPFAKTLVGSVLVQEGNLEDKRKLYIELFDDLVAEGIEDGVIDSESGKILDMGKFYGGVSGIEDKGKGKGKE